MSHPRTRVHVMSSRLHSTALDHLNGHGAEPAPPRKPANNRYSFVFKREATLFGRRASKITTAIVSYFTAVFVMRWPDVMRDKGGNLEPLQYPPQFDGRIVCVDIC